MMKLLNGQGMLQQWQYIVYAKNNHTSYSTPSYSTSIKQYSIIQYTYQTVLHQTVLHHTVHQTYSTPSYSTRILSLTSSRIQECSSYHKTWEHTREIFDRKDSSLSYQNIKQISLGILASLPCNIIPLFLGHGLAVLPVVAGYRAISFRNTKYELTIAA